jgi:thymidylate kinase
MITVALIGPDGAGKTTITRALREQLGLPVQSIYMGVSLDSSGLMLPTTWLVRRLRRARRATPKRAAVDASARSDASAIVSRGVAGARSALRLLNWLVEEWFRQAVAWYYKRRGNVVLFDRHFFFDYYLHDIAATDRSRSPARRIHGFFLKRLYPKPDLVICLDAPAELLFARKPEGSVAAIERRRQEYAYIRKSLPIENLVVVDVARPLDIVIDEVAQLIRDAYRAEVGNGDNR